MNENIEYHRCPEWKLFVLAIIKNDKFIFPKKRNKLLLRLNSLNDNNSEEKYRYFSN
jgi:hypothetical protein